jgi:hypothetical protein
MLVGGIVEGMAGGWLEDSERDDKRMVQGCRSLTGQRRMFGG